MSNFRKIFIGGLPRSGTTMVQNILDSHPSIYGGPEFDRIPNIIDLRNKLLISFESGRISNYTSKQNIDLSISQLIENLFNGIDTQKKYSYISEKTPWNILFFDELVTIFPDAKFIMVLRNPLNVFNSMKNVAKRAKEKDVIPPDFTTNYKIAVAYMETVYKIMQRLLSKYPNNFYLIRYEDLLINLDAQTKNICEFIGVEWTAKLLDFNKIKHPGEEQMTKDDIWYTKSMFNADPEHIIKRKKNFNLSFFERAFITYMFKNNNLIKKSKYFEKLRFLERVSSKLIYYNYKNKYRFTNVPKRVLA